MADLETQTPEPEVNSREAAPVDPSTLGKMFTQADVDRIVRERVARMRDEIRTLQTAEREAVEKWMKAQEQNRELVDRLNAADAARKDAESRRIISERDATLRTALHAANCLDVNAGLRIVRPDLEQDADGNWLLRDGETMLPITAESVSKVLPDTLKRSNIQGRGSGSAVTRSPSLLNAEQIETERAKLAKMEHAIKAAGRYPSDAAMVELRKQRERVRIMEEQQRRRKR